jgi:hypothetical protein
LCLHSGFRRDKFIFLYPFLMTLLLHLYFNLWYIVHIIQQRNYQTMNTLHFFYYCSKDMFDTNINSKQCSCHRTDSHEQYIVNTSCIKVKLLIELMQLIPFVR